MITLHHYLILAGFLFALGFVGVILRRNLLVVLMCIELMLNGVNLSFAAFARFLGNLDGQVASFFVIVLAAAEAAIGLAIVILLFRRKGSVQATDFNLLKD
ncbi:MAG: NADH-quinone oxidoreductase subunit NuoK [Deltaproteobacteria bacterium]|nr:NADH-quinone oxidoreductase subunit NuoK [Deltaproteobacteria bacterium]